MSPSLGEAIDLELTWLREHLPGPFKTINTARTEAGLLQLLLSCRTLHVLADAEIAYKDQKVWRLRENWDGLQDPGVTLRTLRKITTFARSPDPKSPSLSKPFNADLATLTTIEDSLGASILLVSVEIQAQLNPR